jgi:2-dehydro-3-deoxyglucarate aldolase/4-hydroxy-2-oxoheptanedioate aldolase
MKLNRIKQALQEGSTPVGHMIFEFGTRAIAPVLAYAGVDFVLIDMEHSGLSMAQVADLIGWFKSTRIATLVRIPQIERHLIARVMDFGALGIMVPDVRSAAEIQAVISMVKYAPMGERGTGFGLGQTDYQPVDALEFMEFSNLNTTVICQIESQQGLDNLDAIASSPGLDMLWVGHNDLSNNLGIMGQFQHETFLNAMRRVVAVGQHYGLALGIQPGNLIQAREWFAMGFNVISYGSDVSVYRDAMTAAVDGLRQLGVLEE